MDQLSRLGGGNPMAQSGFGGPMAFMPGAATPRLGGLDMMPPMGATNPMFGANPMQGALAGGDQMMTMMLQMLLQLLMTLMMNGGANPNASGASPAGLGGADPMGMGGGGGFGGGDSTIGGGGGGGGGYGGGDVGSGGGGGGGGGGGSSSVGSSGGGGSSYNGPVPDPGPVAPGTAALLKDAGDMVGLNENRDRARIQQVTGESGINPATTPWCAAFAINMMKDHGVLDTSGLSNPNYCPTIKSWAQGKQNWGENGKYTPKPGDAILFDWQGDGTSDHIGIVESVKDGKVYTIEGNSSDSVKRNVYNLGDSKIDGYVVSKDATKGDSKPGEAAPKAAAKPAAPKETPKEAPKSAAPKESAPPSGSAKK